MNPVTYSLTPDDWAEYQLWLYENQSNREASRRLQLSFSLLILIPAYLFLFAIFGFSLALLLTLAAAIAATVTANRYFYSPEQIRKQLLFRARQDTTQSDTRTVSLTPRGVLEVDDCEERLTLYEAISETTLTEKFLYSKDKKGGILLIPTRTFASPAAASAFHMELENRRMRHAVGLTPAVSISTAPVVTVSPPIVEAPRVTPAPTQPQAAQPWWRSAPKVENESVPNRKQ